jgi:hypothetical protein
MNRYHIQKEINGYDPLQWIFVVIRNSDGRVMGQHATRADAHDQARNLEGRQLR